MRLILGPDTPLITELVTTTEKSDLAGNKTYYPQQKDREHNTDSLRCVALCIRDMDRETAVDPSSFGGWAGSEYGGAGVSSEYRRPTWKAPWG